MGISYTTHAREQMEARGITELHIAAVLERRDETFIGESIKGPWVYHTRVGRKSIYVLVEPHSDPVVIISVRPWCPMMRNP